MNLPNDISEMSHSRFLMKRKKISSTGSMKAVSTMPSGPHRAVGQVAHVVVVGMVASVRCSRAVPPLSMISGCAIGARGAPSCSLR